MATSDEIDNFNNESEEKPDMTYEQLISEALCFASGGMLCCNYLSQWWVEFKFELTWDCLQLSFLIKCCQINESLDNGKKQVLRRIWLISANNIKTSESVSKQSSQLKLELNSSLWQIIAALELPEIYEAISSRHPYYSEWKQNWQNKIRKQLYENEIFVQSDKGEFIKKKTM